MKIIFIKRLQHCVEAAESEINCGAHCKRGVLLQENHFTNERWSDFTLPNSIGAPCLKSFF